MSKEVEWGLAYGEGQVVCSCDNCHSDERFDFEDNNPDYPECQRKLLFRGWVSTKFHGVWKDFCCETCRNEYIKSHT